MHIFCTVLLFLELPTGNNHLIWCLIHLTLLSNEAIQNYSTNICIVKTNQTKIIDFIRMPSKQCFNSQFSSLAGKCVWSSSSRVDSVHAPSDLMDHYVPWIESYWVSQIRWFQRKNAQVCKRKRCTVQSYAMSFSINPECLASIVRILGQSPGGKYSRSSQYHCGGARTHFFIRCEFWTMNYSSLTERLSETKEISSNYL